MWSVLSLTFEKSASCIEGSFHWAHAILQGTNFVRLHWERCQLTACIVKWNFHDFYTEKALYNYPLAYCICFSPLYFCFCPLSIDWSSHTNDWHPLSVFPLAVRPVEQCINENVLSKIRDISVRVLLASYSVELTSAIPFLPTSILPQLSNMQGALCGGDQGGTSIEQ